MKWLKVFLGLFRRRTIGPLSVSPVGLVLFCLLVAVAIVIYRGVYEAKEIRSHSVNGERRSARGVRKPAGSRQREPEPESGRERQRACTRMPRGGRLGRDGVARFPRV